LLVADGYEIGWLDRRERRRRERRRLFVDDDLRPGRE
jgi:hypothetical protein